jgi:hypothetical protein
MRLLFALCIALAAMTASADTPAPQQPPPKPVDVCKAGHHREFDFWVGDWDVYGPKGRLLGHNTITRDLDDCVIAEHWRGNGGTDGKSHNIYDAARGRWTQYWVDNGGNTLLLHGGFRDGSMVLRGDTPAQGNQPAATQRITWTPQPDGRVRQHWETSTDAGQTWTTAFDGWYQKAGTPAPTAD